MKFFQAIRNYLDDPNLAYGYASTADLKRHFEVQSNSDLSYYFEAWYEKQGYPSYELDWTYLGGIGIKLNLNQMTSHPSNDFLKFHCQ